MRASTVVLVVLPLRALGQEAPADKQAPAEAPAPPREEAGPRGPRLPEIARDAPPVYPLGQTNGATVTLHVGVSERGEVVWADVLEHAGEDFDAAAVQAAWNHVFRPLIDEAG